MLQPGTLLLDWIVLLFLLRVGKIRIAFFKPAAMKATVLLLVLVYC